MVKHDTVELCHGLTAADKSTIICITKNRVSSCIWNVEIVSSLTGQSSSELVSVYNHLEMLSSVLAAYCDPFCADKYLR